jgi:cytosine/adenosine deaminase-related metal-dependent hydrolase
MGHGTPPSLSVDVETNQPSGMFIQMHACFALQRVFINQQNLFPSVPPAGSLLTVRDVLELATVVGARTNGLGRVTGTLTPGKEADLILLRTKHINVGPINDAIVLGMDSRNVDSVWIAGRAVKRNGKLRGVDVDRLLR